MLQQRNGNSLDHALVQQKPKIALIQRGHCNWSQKIQTVMNVSSANDLKVSAAIVYDNVTRQDAGFVIKPSSGFRGIGPYDSTLPTNRNISSMSDNDLSNASLRIPVYFVPKDYGDTLLNASNIDPAYPGYTELMQLCAYLDGAWFTNGKGNPSVWVISRGYLSYVIALAAVFLIGKTTCIMPTGATSYSCLMNHSPLCRYHFPPLVASSPAARAKRIRGSAWRTRI